MAESDTTVTSAVSVSTLTQNQAFKKMKSILDPFFSGTKIGLSALHSGNGSKLRTVKRMNITYKDVSINFAINPSDYTQKFPNRVNMTQTKGGAWLDTWGRGIVEFNIRGVTGVSGRKDTMKADPNDYFSKIANTALDIAKVIAGDSGVDEGYQRWKRLRDLFLQVYQDGEDGNMSVNSRRTNSGDIVYENLIQFKNYTDNEYWYCYPMPNGLELYRSNSKPHMYQYTINLWGIAPMTQPTEEEGVIGDPEYQDPLVKDISKILGTTDQVSDNSLGDDDNGVTPEGERVEAVMIKDSTGQWVEVRRKLQTAQSQEVTAQGGIAYKTQTVALNSEVDLTTKTSTKTKSTYSLREHSEKLAKEMSLIMGGHDGLLVPSTAYFTAKDLNITNLGIVLNITAFDKNLMFKHAGDIIPTNRLLEEMRFSPVVSPESYKLWNQILSYSPDVLTPEFSPRVGFTTTERIKHSIKLGNYYGSSLFDYTTQYSSKYYLTQVDTLYIKQVLLECMTIYLALYQVSQSSGQITMSYTISDVQTLIRNIQSLIIYLQFMNTEYNLFYIRNVMWELRRIESILHKIKMYVLEYL